jgi:hypothetical protein
MGLKSAKNSDCLGNNGKYRYGGVKNNMQEADYNIIVFWNGIAKA